MKRFLSYFSDQIIMYLSDNFGLPEEKIDKHRHLLNLEKELLQYKAKDKDYWKEKSDKLELEIKELNKQRIIDLQNQLEFERKEKKFILESSYKLLSSSSLSLENQIEESIEWLITNNSVIIIDKNLNQIELNIDLNSFVSILNNSNKFSCIFYSNNNSYLSLVIENRVIKFDNYIWIKPELSWNKNFKRIIGSDIDG